MSHSFSSKILAHLGTGLSHLQTGSVLSPALEKLRYMNYKKGSHLYFEANETDIDTDGAQTPGIHYEGTHQSRLSIDGLHPGLQPVIQSNAIQFFVLPLPGKLMVSDLGVRLGDVGIVMHESGKLCAAAWLDDGPSTKISEVSLQTARTLGFERITPTSHIHDVGIDGVMAYLIFPGSAPDYMNGKEWASMSEISQRIHDRSVDLFTKFGGKI